MSAAAGTCWLFSVHIEPRLTNTDLLMPKATKDALYFNFHNYLFKLGLVKTTQWAKPCEPEDPSPMPRPYPQGGRENQTLRIVLSLHTHSVPTQNTEREYTSVTLSKVSSLHWLPSYRVIYSGNKSDVFPFCLLCGSIKLPSLYHHLPHQYSRWDLWTNPRTGTEH